METEKRPWPHSSSSAGLRTAAETAVLAADGACGTHPTRRINILFLIVPNLNPLSTATCRNPQPIFPQSHTDPPFASIDHSHPIHHHLTCTVSHVLPPSLSYVSISTTHARRPAGPAKGFAKRMPAHASEGCINASHPHRRQHTTTRPFLIPLPSLSRSFYVPLHRPPKHHDPPCAN